MRREFFQSPWKPPMDPLLNHCPSLPARVTTILSLIATTSHFSLQSYHLSAHRFCLHFFKKKSLKHLLIHRFFSSVSLFFLQFIYWRCGITYLQFPAAWMLLVASPEQSLVCSSSLYVSTYPNSGLFVFGVLFFWHEILWVICSLSGGMQVSMSLFFVILVAIDVQYSFLIH